MKRWNCALGAEVESQAVDAYLAEVVEVGKRHGMSLSHEDRNGAFVVRRRDWRLDEWLLMASDGTTPVLAYKGLSLADRATALALDPEDVDGRHALAMGIATRGAPPGATDEQIRELTERVNIAIAAVLLGVPGGAEL